MDSLAYDSCEEEADWIRGHSLGASPDEVVQNELADHEVEGNDDEGIHLTYFIVTILRLSISIL
jgi:hypothetical protein